MFEQDFLTYPVITSTLQNLELVTPNFFQHKGCIQIFRFVCMYVLFI